MPKSIEHRDSVQNLENTLITSYENINGRITDLTKRLNVQKNAAFIDSLLQMNTVAATIADNTASLSKNPSLQKAAVHFMGEMDTFTSVLRYALQNRKKLSPDQVKPMADKLVQSQKNFRNELQKNNLLGILQIVGAVMASPVLTQGCVNATSINSVSTNTVRSNGEVTSTTRVETVVNGKRTVTETTKSNVEFSGREIPCKITFMDRNGAPMKIEGLGISLSAHTGQAEQNILRQIKPANTRSSTGGGNLEDAFTDETGALNETMSFPNAASKKWILTVSNASGYAVDYVVIDQATLQKNYKNGQVSLSNIKLTRVRKQDF